MVSWIGEVSASMCRYMMWSLSLGCDDDPSKCNTPRYESRWSLWENSIHTHIALPCHPLPILTPCARTITNHLSTQLPRSLNTTTTSNCCPFTMKFMKLGKSIMRFTTKIFNNIGHFWVWYHFREGSPHQIIVYNSHKNLTYLQNVGDLSRQQAHLAQFLDFVSPKHS